MASTRKAVLALYKGLIKESKKWSSYNYRMYALRKIRNEFQHNKSLVDQAKIQECYQRGIDNLEMIKRQVTVANLYSTKPLVIEGKASGK